MTNMSEESKRLHARYREELKKYNSMYHWLVYYKREFKGDFDLYRYEWETPRKCYDIYRDILFYKRQVKKQGVLLRKIKDEIKNYYRNNI